MWVGVQCVVANILGELLKVNKLNTPRRGVHHKGEAYVLAMFLLIVDNPQHSDFARLRSALLRYVNKCPMLLTPSNDINSSSSGSSHLQDLKEITHDFLYENYRTEKLSRTVSGGEQE